MLIKLRQAFPRCSRLPLQVSVTVLILCSSSLDTFGTPPKKSKGKAQKGAFPMLDILPKGSILRRVQFPRYDENFVPLSLLSAESMTVIDRNRIEGRDVSIELYAKNGSTDTRVKMRRAIYNTKQSVLRAKEAIFLEGDSYIANGTGIVFDWRVNQGFLLGPAGTRFYHTKTTQSTSMQSRPAPLSSSVAHSLAYLTVLSTSTLAEPSTKLTAPQAADIKYSALPSKLQIEEYHKQTRQMLNENEKLNHKANSVITPFLKRTGYNKILARVKPSVEPTAPKPKAPSSSSDKKPLQEQTLKVTCDGGLFFDTNSGILAYLKNIKLTEPRFTLTCTDELKVFLEEKEPSKKNSSKESEGPAKEKKPTQLIAKDSKEKAISNFGALNRILASGTVKIVRKNEKGQTYIATADTASYDAKTGEMILTGGNNLRLQLGPKQYLQSRAPGQYIRILKNGKFITKGKWTMETPTKIKAL